MLRFYFFLVLLVVGRVALLDDTQRIQRKNPLELKLIEKRLKENPGLMKIDPTLVQDDNVLFESSKSLISKNIFALIIDQLTKMSNFPTLVATNISEKCYSDSQVYYDANLLLVNWANQMYESTGRSTYELMEKLTDGIFNKNNVYAKGLFDQCINVQAKWISTSFTGKYCTVFIDSVPVMPDDLQDAIDGPNKESTQNKNVSFFENFGWLFNGPTLKQPKVRDTDLQSKFLTHADFCIPSSCSMEDFRNAVAQLIGSRAIDTTTLDGNRSLISMVAITDEKYCYTSEKINATPQFNGADIAVISAFSLLGIVTLLATVHELWNIYNNHPVQTDKDGLCFKALHCFSMITNCRNLLSTKSAAIDNLGCLNGIRVIATAWIIIFHTYQLLNTGYISTYNRFTFKQDALTWHIHGLLINAGIAVDTFFFMSGLLVSYSLLRELDRNKGRFNIGLFYLHRYLRLTAVYAFILGFIATLLPYLGSGPYWQTMRDWSTACQSNWWNNLLYINNYVMTYPLMCMDETWYLACDMQMFLFSPLFIYPLWKWWKGGVAFAVFTIVAILTGIISFCIIRDFSPMTLGFTRTPKVSGGFFFFYIQTWIRCPPYILGIIIGWALHRSKNNSITMNKFVVAVVWLLAIANILAISYGLFPYLDSIKFPEINSLIRISYSSLTRLAWASSVAWIVFACNHGYGGFVNRLLSWKGFLPFSRLTYVVYLIHLNYLRAWHTFKRNPYYYTRFTHTEHIFGTMLMVCLMAFAICLVIEVPFLNLEKLILPARSRKSRVNETETQRKEP